MFQSHLGYYWMYPIVNLVPGRFLSLLDIERITRKVLDPEILEVPFHTYNDILQHREPS